MAEPALNTQSYDEADGVKTVYFYHIVDGHRGSRNVVVASEDVEKLEAIEDSTQKLAAIEAYTHPENAAPEPSNPDQSRGDHG